MKRIGFLIACAIFGCTMTFAQAKAGFSVSETTHDFGTVYSEDGDVSHEFIVTNTGDAPLELQNVKAGCSCTRPTWTNTPIEPGKTGTIKITYKAKGRPGPINRTISINTNVQEAPFTVKITGNVLAEKPTVDMQVKQPNLTNVGK